MARRILWTEIAYEDLHEAYRYIARDSVNYAAAFSERVLQTVSTLDAFPFGGRMVPEFGDTTVRETYVGRHRLIYKVTENAIQVLALIHGARDLASLWEREQRPRP
ncbi:MAG: type II toxin-antitoxin system RelE/ParE family toxin [Tepidisphaerales bacterium]